jgi:hypothetical protein
MVYLDRAQRGLFILWLIALLPGGVAAQDASPYTVTDIAVDATAADAVGARAEALAEGQRQGLAELLRRLTPSREHGSLPSLAGVPIDAYVQNFSIEDEQLSATRYMASLTVTYDPAAVKDLLRARGLSFADAGSAPIVVLPLYLAADGSATLWPDDNPWWTAWSETLDPNGLLRLTLPLGDLEDITSLSAEQVAARDRDPILALAGRYGAGDVLIAQASPIADGAAIRLDVERLGALDRVGTPSTVEMRPGQSEAEALELAASRIQESLAEQWKEGNLLSFAESGRMLVDVPIRSLGDWVNARRTLEGMPEVEQVEVFAFSREMVQTEIGYVGDELRLEEALYRQGLMLSREGDTWQLRPAGVNPPGQANATSASSSSVPPSTLPIPSP